MSRLFSLARQVSEYIRNRFMRRYRDVDAEVELTEQQRERSLGSRRGLPSRLPDILQRPAQRQPPKRPLPRPADSPQRPIGPEPPQPLRPNYQPPIVPPRGATAAGDEEFDDIQLLGRDAGYDQADFDAIMDSLRRTPGSSNVWGYFFEREARRTGILYVTFLRTGMDGKKIMLPGPTYAYYDVPVTKALAFQRAAPASAGGAVWEYLRIRGSIAGHQHQYRLVHVDGEYVPRKASPFGYVERAVPAIGVGRRGFRRNTLSPIRWGNPRPNRGRPDRGEPDRGEPDRGGPDRGETD